MSGPLEGVRVVELAGLGPGPFCGMLLSDMGAEVIRVTRPDTAPDPYEVAGRGRRSIAVNLKDPRGAEVVLRLAERADAVYEGYRPGVAERLGIGPDACRARNPRLVYGRMTGWGQDGPLAGTAGHDIDYISVAGALHPIGPAGAPPPPPLNLVGDFGGGGMLLAFGLVAGVLSARATGTGQVVDAAMTDGSALLTAMMHGRMAAGRWTPDREANILDGAAPFYTTYTCADGRYIAVGAIEPQFTAELLDGLGVAADDPDRAVWYDQAAWPRLRDRVAAIFATRSRDEWAAVFAGSDACVAPVLSLAEAPVHPHNAARGTFVTQDGVVQPAAAPRFSATPGAPGGPPRAPGQDTDAVLADHGFTAAEVAGLRGASVVC
ncbi:MAG TPA: CaiB/BaiF CoA-transferase family protein [Streptosporangiaceae bacterium]|jgi:alpha-methylacyl-CoA racemase